VANCRYHRRILQAAKRLNASHTFYWVASDGWGKQQKLVEGLEDVAEGAITVELQSDNIPGFDEYMMSLTPDTNHRNPWFEQYWEDTFDCILEKKRPSGNLHQLQRVQTRTPAFAKNWVSVRPVSRNGAFAKMQCRRQCTSLQSKRRASPGCSRFPAVRIIRKAFNSLFALKLTLRLNFAGDYILTKVVFSRSRSFPMCSLQIIPKLLTFKICNYRFLGLH
jgi:hypothetical protein